MRRNQIVISETSTRAAESAGVVPKKASGVTLNISLNVKLASKDPASCAPIYDVSESIYKSYSKREDKLPDTKETAGKWQNR
ncbi:hypothetical protein DY000_02033922 [Brassica cretica]|uniref:Uncharacterized protein n=1 Tax=Brassica cretica TaxID=69181 RepID=A0ABQ7DFP2_BRACR|nr:hypothetical protein DY000_02033922 [Brassica cretica]